MLMMFLVLWLATFIGLAITVWIVPGIRVRSTGALLLAALVLVIANSLIRPLLLLLTLPLTVLTFGLFILVINALMFLLTSSIVSGFEVKGFGAALLGAIVMALLTLTGMFLLNWLMLDQATIIIMPPQHAVNI
jgi:putative membrane protein